MSGSICPACGSMDVSGSWRIPDHEYATPQAVEYAQCSRCDTLFQRPMPDVATLAQYYPPNYHSFTGTGLVPRIKHRTRLKRLASFIGSDAPVVLDYGCGDGAFIHEAAAHTVDWTFWGFEIASRREKQTSFDGRVTVVRGGLHDLLEELPVCDVVTMNHVIEHLPDPVCVLAALSNRMRAGAILEGQTPAADSLERRMFGRAWSGYHAPRHTVIFSRVGLRTALERAGFVHPQVIAAFNPAGIAVSLASMTHGEDGGTVRREGLRWLAYLGMATALFPIDRMSGSPGIVNYAARKREDTPGSERWAP